MAFMMPLMRKDFDIYKNNGKPRRTSEGASNGRSRKASESSRSEGPSLSTSPGSEYGTPSHRNLHPVNSAASRYQFSRTSSRNSSNSLVTSPTKTSVSCSPPKTGSSQNSLNKFHSRLVDKLRRSFSSKSNSTSSTES